MGVKFKFQLLDPDGLDIFFSAAPTGQNSPELIIRFIDSCIQCTICGTISGDQTLQFLGTLVMRVHSREQFMTFLISVSLSEL